MIKSFGSAGLALVTLGAGLGLYMVSYNVASERSVIDNLQRQIESDRRDIRALEAELRVRANLPQLERWNSEVLQMAAPAPRQILASEVELAELVTPRRPAPLLRAVAARSTPPAAGDRVATAASASREPARSTMHRAIYDAPAAADRPAVTVAHAGNVGGKIAPKTAPKTAPPTAPATPPVAAVVAGPAAQGVGALFSEAFVAEIETAAASERATFRKVALR